MKRLTFVAAIAAGLFCVELSAQQTNTGAFGQRTTGGTTGVSAPRTNSGNTGSSSQGASFGNDGTNSTESPSGLTMMRSGDDVGQASADARYIRGNRAAGDFVGVDNGEARAVGVMDIGTGGGSRGGQQFASLFSSSGRGGGNNVLGQLLGGQFNQGGNGRTRSSSGGNTQLRIPIRMDFTTTPAATSRFTGQFQKRLGKLPGLTTVTPIQVLLDGEEVVLRGVVASEGDRQLAEDLARLEPEVSKVRNELTVQTPDELDAAAPAAPTPGIP